MSEEYFAGDPSGGLSNLPSPAQPTTHEQRIAGLQSQIAALTARVANLEENALFKIPQFPKEEKK
jgi:hypothetical protein